MMSKERKKGCWRQHSRLCLLEDLAAGTMMSACMMVLSRVKLFHGNGTLGLASVPRCVGVSHKDRSLGSCRNGRAGCCWARWDGRCCGRRANGRSNSSGSGTRVYVDGGQELWDVGIGKHRGWRTFTPHGVVPRELGKSSGRCKAKRHITARRQKK